MFSVLLFVFPLSFAPLISTVFLVVNYPSLPLRSLEKVVPQNFATAKGILTNNVLTTYALTKTITASQETIMADQTITSSL